MNNLLGRKVAILAADDFEWSELVEPRRALEKEGAETVIISPKNDGVIRGVYHDKQAGSVAVDMTLDSVYANDFDAVLLPGGALNADVLRMEVKAQEFVREMDKSNKPIAVICHGPWLLVSAKLVKGRTLTSYYTIQDDIRNAGGKWVDREVVINDNWVSSRMPADLPVFNREMIKLFSESQSQEAAMYAA